jgi:hypothetical protein
LLKLFMAYMMSSGAGPIELESECGDAVDLLSRKDED